jgi:phage tail sheath protein FI
MAMYLSPMVDVKEIDLTTTIPAVATSIGAIVLRNTWKGPELKQTLITSETELINMFGKTRKRVYDHSGDDSITADCYKDMLSAMGYLKYGNKLYCTRTMPASATFAGTTIKSDGTWTNFVAGLTALTLNSETLNGDITDPDDFHDEVEATDMGTDHIWMIAASRGYWGNNTRVVLVDKTTQTQMLSGGLSTEDTYNTVIGVDSRLDDDDDFLIIVQHMERGTTDWDTVEVWNVSLDENAVDDQGISKFAETAINDGSDYIRIALLDSQKNLATVPSAWVTNEFEQFGGGSDNGSDSISDAVIMEGYELYQNAEELDVNILIDSDKSETVKEKLIDICESRLDAMCVLDVKYAHVVNNKGSEVTDMTQWRKGITSPGLNVNTSYAAIYGNWFNVYDKYLKEYVWVPTSGYMAGIFARTDNLRDPWWAPAGLNRAIVTSVRKLAFNPTKGNRDIMYMSGINPIVSFAGQGKTVWGQKTLLDKSSAFNRINVRRLFMVLEKAISTASKYFLFEQNDKYTWAQMKAMIEPFLRDVQSRRGIYDFYVQIDEQNNTAERIDRNELWANIFIKPTRSAEFIVLQFVATKTGASFEELFESV